MNNRKIYSAFISSVYESLQNERSLVIDALLDHKIFPVCMEHFTVSSSGKFYDIESRIDESDFFILLLGSQYGSVDDQGVSWTEREYRYAVQMNKQILTIVCEELNENLRKDFNMLSPSEQKQIKFRSDIAFARTISHDLPIEKIIGQFLSQVDYSRCAGWIQGKPESMSNKVLEEWRAEHKAFDLSGAWYHVQRSVEDETYIRIGTIEIIQTFDPDNYKKLYFKGCNYSINRIDEKERKISENKLKSTYWEGEHTINDHGEISGIVRSQREFKDVFNAQAIDRGYRKAIHDFKVNIGSKEKIMEFEGEFHDAAPSPKFGNLYIFRKEEDRFEFILENFPYLFKK